MLPSNSCKNWKWRMQSHELTDEVAENLRMLLEKFYR